MNVSLWSKQPGDMLFGTAVKDPVLETAVKTFFDLIPKERFDEESLKPALNYLESLGQSDQAHVYHIVDASRSLDPDVIKTITKVFGESKKPFVALYHNLLTAPPYSLFGDKRCDILGDYRRSLASLHLVADESHAEFIKLRNEIVELNPRAVVDLFLEKGFEERLTNILYEERLKIYRDLLGKCVECLKSKKGKSMTQEHLESSKRILQKHLELIKNHAIDKGEPTITCHLYPLVEACLNSSDTVACEAGLRVLSHGFLNKKPSVDGNEVDLAGSFLSGKRSYKDHGVVEARRELERAVLSARPRPNINYSKIALSLKDSPDIDIAVEYFLVWLEKIQRKNHSKDIAQDGECLMCLAKLAQQCSLETFYKIISALNNFSSEKIELDEMKELFQILFQMVFKRSVGHAQQDPSKSVEVLRFFADNLSRLNLPTVSVSQLYVDVLIDSIKESSKDKAAAVFLEIMDAVLRHTQEKLVADSLLEQAKKKKSAKDKKHDEAQPVSKNQAAALFMGTLFRGVLEVLPQEKELKGSILESLAEMYCQSAKTFNCRINGDQFLFLYVANLDPEHEFDEATLDMALDILESSRDAAKKFKDFSEEHIPVNFLKVCTRHGMIRFLISEESPKRICLFDRLIELTDVLLKSQATVPDKLGYFDLLFAGITYSAENKQQVIKTLQGLFIRSKDYYKDHQEVYWKHFYSFGKFGNVSVGNEDKSDDCMKIRRTALGSLVGVLVRQNSIESLIQALAILYNKHLEEFVGHFEELTKHYGVVFEALREKFDPEVACNIMANWVNAELANPVSNASIFMKYFSETKKIKLDKESDRQAFSNLMKDVVFTYRTIYTKAVKSSPNTKKELCTRFIAHMGMMSLMCAFEIDDLYDLQNFEVVSKYMSDFIKEQNVAKTLKFDTVTIFKAFTDVALRSTYRVEPDYTVIKDRIFREWESIV